MPVRPPNRIKTRLDRCTWLERKNGHFLRHRNNVLYLSEEPGEQAPLLPDTLSPLVLHPQRSESLKLRQPPLAALHNRASLQQKLSRLLSRNGRPNHLQPQYPTTAPCSGNIILDDHRVDNREHVSVRGTVNTSHLLYITLSD